MTVSLNHIRSINNIYYKQNLLGVDYRVYLVIIYATVMDVLIFNLII